MAKCGAGECECECKNGCGCIASSDEPETCECRCFNETGGTNFGVLEGVNATTKINVHFRGANAAQVAVALSRALGVQLAVPTSLLNKRVTVRLMNTPVRSVVKQLGLVQLKRASTNRSRKRSR